jgi:hypothetical protein
MRRTASLSSTSHPNTLRQQFAAKLDDEGNNGADDGAGEKLEKRTVREGIERAAHALLGTCCSARNLQHNLLLKTRLSAPSVNIETMLHEGG